MMFFIPNEVRGVLLCCRGHSHRILSSTDGAAIQKGGKNDTDNRDKKKICWQLVVRGCNWRRWESRMLLGQQDGEWPSDVSGFFCFVLLCFLDWRLDISLGSHANSPITFSPEPSSSAAPISIAPSLFVRQGFLPPWPLSPCLSWPSLNWLLPLQAALTKNSRS